jgi:hypothetical protein
MEPLVSGQPTSLVFLIFILKARILGCRSPTAKAERKCIISLGYRG